jgi:hypothetical protein
MYANETFVYLTLMIDYGNVIHQATFAETCNVISDIYRGHIEP